jgi:adenosylcobinamide-GDP ribazoletransferase
LKVADDMGDPRGAGPGLDDLASALSLLSRLPVPAHRFTGAAAAWAWPLAGLLHALIAAAVSGLALKAGLPVPLAAVLALGMLLALDGGLHEDGLADLADGLGGGRDASRSLAIMKDSRIGSFGALVLFLALSWRLLALAALAAQGGAALAGGLIASAVLSRGAMAGVMAALPFARADGLARATGRPDLRGVAAGAALALAFGFAATGLAVLPAAIAAALAALAIAGIALRRLGGQTGDVLGAVQVVAECAALGALAAAA